jgi:hypothetical protein
MAITTLNGVLAGMLPPRSFQKVATPAMVTGRPHSLFYLAGQPGAAVAPSPGLAGAALTTYAGQIPWTNPTGGLNSYLARLQFQSGVVGTLAIYDRLWHNSGLSLTIATAQTINSAAFPARDADGSTNGNQVLVGLEVSTATGAGTPTFSMTYTNSAGTASRVGTGVIAGVATSAIGAFYPMALAAGDQGVRSIQDFTLSATWTSGAAHLVAYREIARIEVPANGGASLDALASGFPRLYDNSTLMAVWLPTGAGAVTCSGQIIFTQG